MLPRKKEIKPFCDLLSHIIGPFSLIGFDGRKIYDSDGVVLPENARRVKVSVDQIPAGEILGNSEDLEAAAALLGMFLQNIKEKKVMVAHTLQKYREMGFLAEINTIMGSSVDISEILNAATAKVHEIIRIESCSVLLPDYRSGSFILQTISGRFVNEPIGLKIDAGIAGRVLETGNSIIANNPAEDPLFVNTGSAISSLLCMPLKVKDKTIGVLMLKNKADSVFTTEDEALLNSVCTVIAEAIENARLLDEKIRDEKFTAVGQMAAGIIHDIKNPMTTIKGFAGLMGDMEFTKAELKEYSGMIIKEVDRLVGMIEDLLAFTRGFKTTLSIDRINAESFVDSVLPYIERDMSARGITVLKKVDFSGDLKLDIERFKRVVFNIAGNAREEMHSGGKFAFLIRQSNQSVEIVFSDSGDGIPIDIVDTLFEPFVTKGKKSGTGLGLAVTRKIVEEHGGTIRAVNGNYSGIEGFSGANFVITMPLAN